MFLLLFLFSNNYIAIVLFYFPFVVRQKFLSLRFLYFQASTKLLTIPRYHDPTIVEIVEFLSLIVRRATNGKRNEVVMWHDSRDSLAGSWIVLRLIYRIDSAGRLILHFSSPRSNDEKISVTSDRLDFYCFLSTPDKCFFDSSQENAGISLLRFLCSSFPNGRTHVCTSRRRKIVSSFFFFLLIIINIVEQDVEYRRSTKWV